MEDTSRECEKWHAGKGRLGKNGRGGLENILMRYNNGDADTQPLLVTQHHCACHQRSCNAA